MTGVSIALAALCVVSWLLLGGCYQAVRTLRARTLAAERREAKANEERIAAQARADVLARRVSEWSRAAGEREARIAGLVEQAGELLASRERHAEALAEQVEECARLEAALAEGDRRWIGAIRSERPKHHPSGKVAQALNGVERKVRGGS
jgi:chromosome segregation ATPase